MAGRKKPSARRSAAKRATRKPAAKTSAGAADLRSRVESWAGSEEELTVVSERDDPGLDLALQIDRSGPVFGRAEVRLARGADRVTIVRAWALAPGTTTNRETALFKRVARAVGVLPGLIRYHVRRDETWPVLEMAATVYLDGFTRQAFMSSLDDLMQAGAAAHPHIERAGGRDALTGAAPEAATSQVTPTGSPGFAPTHEVPGSGLPAWGAPDPSSRTIATLRPGVRLQVLEERGAWAHVLGENGWKGWVDGRHLKAVKAG